MYISNFFDMDKDILSCDKSDNVWNEQMFIT